jgi:CelD/BcsL family acetyltransferase involved in cellulose biosynthesis
LAIAGDAKTVGARTPISGYHDNLSADDGRYCVLRASISSYSAWRLRSPDARLAPVSSNGLAFDTLTSVEELDSLADDWDALVRSMRKPTPYLLFGLVRAWFRYYGGDAEPSVHVARRNGAVVAILPFAVHRSAGLRVASFIGYSRTGDSPYGDTLLAPGEEAETAKALATYAEKSHDYTYLHSLLADSSLVETCRDRLSLVPRVGLPLLDISQGYQEAYRRQTSSRTRNTQKRKWRQLRELGEVDLKLARSPEELGEALEDAFRLHALRWQGRHDFSTFRTIEGRAFNREALAALAPSDVARILTLTLDGRAIAFLYYFSLAERMVIYRLGFDPAYSRYSVGLVTTLSAIEQAAEEDDTEVDFGSGTERYKLELADRIEPLYRAVGLAGSLRGSAFAQGQVLRLSLRANLKRSETLRRAYWKYVMRARNRIYRTREGTEKARSPKT